MKTVRRGYTPDDERDFTGDALKKLCRAADDLYCIINRGYPVKAASTFVGNRYQLSGRQRLALARAVSSQSDISRRRAKQADTIPPETEVNIDGFNTVITLEVALSGSLVLKCMDGTIRDLAGLRGTYRIIDKTRSAVRLILQELINLKAAKAHFYLDAPVSNSGRLKALITDLAEEMGMKAVVEVIDDVDHTLQALPYVVSSDAVILDKCPSWINLNARIIDGIDGLWKLDCFGPDA